MPHLKAFESYTIQLEELAAKTISAPLKSIDLSDDIIIALDGGSSATLRRVVPIETRREIGAYFTSASLAEQAVEFFKEPIPDDAVFLDCACGAGDLLLAAAQRLPIYSDLPRTLSVWGEQLIGFDLQPEFIRAAKARLVLSAIERGARRNRTSIPANDELFPSIHIADGLTQTADFAKVTHITINPSFAKQTVPDDCVWATEKVSAAAIFLHVCVSNSAPGTKIVAILPDVLRSGSNYAKWRKEIALHATIEEIKVVGKFDTWTDVDVFMVRLTAGDAQNQIIQSDWWNGSEEEGTLTVGGQFDIEVGRVVPHRDPKKGRWHPYIYSRILPKWETVRRFSTHRRFAGKVFKPPFVAVRRTSRPEDQYRAVGTLVSGHEEIAVENHLIVLTPKDGLVRTCRELLEVLRSPETNDWLNERIRCRHLTVPALQELPYGVKQ